MMKPVILKGMSPCLVILHNNKLLQEKITFKTESDFFLVNYYFCNRHALDTAVVLLQDNVLEN